MLHPSLDQKVSSWVGVAFDIVSKVALVIAFVLFMLIITEGIILIITPELDVYPYERVK